jgi:hypothetical protein
VFRGAPSVTMVKHLPHTRAQMRQALNTATHGEGHATKARCHQRVIAQRRLLAKFVFRLILLCLVTSSIARSNSEAQTFTAEPRAAIYHQNELESSPRILSIVKASITTSYIPSTLPPITSTLNLLSLASPHAASHTITMLSSRLSRTVSKCISEHSPNIL